jgi:hypothetical protein
MVANGAKIMSTNKALTALATSILLSLFTLSTAYAQSPTADETQQLGNSTSPDVDPSASQGPDKSIVNQEKMQLNNSTKEDVPSGASNGASSGTSGSSTPSQSQPQMEEKDLQ